MLKNLMTFVAALVVSLAIGEVVLRAFTPFPVNDKSNKVSDPELGYRLRPDALGFDSLGFRNPEDKHGIYQVAAIGDSQTYGINVSMGKSWPGVFEKITEQPTYNYGVSSYGILSYHALVRKEVKRGTKYIIVALYPSNDFIKSWSYCTIDFKRSEFWLNEIDRMDLNLSNETGICAESRSRSLTEWNKKQVWRFLKYNFALVSAMHHLVFSKFKRPREQEFYNFPSGIPPVSVDATLQHGGNANLASKDIDGLYQQFRKFVADWVILSRENGAKIGILVIPSKAQVIFRLLERKGLVGQADPSFVASVRSLDKLDILLKDYFRTSGMPFQNASESLVNALENSIEENTTFYPVGDLHPFEAGYEAYADAAAKLWSEMRARQ